MKNLLIGAFITASFSSMIGMELSDKALSFLQGVPSGASVGIYCGTFDPIHFGHIANIDYCFNTRKTDFIIVHVGSAPEKPHATDRQTRALMAKSALDSHARVFVSTENLQKLHEYLGQKGCERVSIWGSDNLHRLLKNTPATTDLQKKDPFPFEELLILPRAEDNGMLQTLKAERLFNNKPLHIASMEGLPYRDVSSTQIRTGIYHEPDMELNRFVDRAVISIIRSRNLYASN